MILMEYNVLIKRYLIFVMFIGSIWMKKKCHTIPHTQAYIQVATKFLTIPQSASRRGATLPIAPKSHQIHRSLATHARYDVTATACHILPASERAIKAMLCALWVCVCFGFWVIGVVLWFCTGALNLPRRLSLTCRDDYNFAKRIWIIYSYML